MIVEFDQVFATLHALLKAQSHKGAHRVVVSLPGVSAVKGFTQLFQLMGGVEAILQGASSDAASTPSSFTPSPWSQLFDASERGVSFQHRNDAISPNTTLIVHLGVRVRNCKSIYFPLYYAC
jgi:hypothetical protein